MAGKKKTTFAKMSREQKVREKRMLKQMRKEERKLEGPAETTIAEEPESLDHLDRLDRMDPVMHAAEAPPVTTS